MSNRAGIKLSSPRLAIVMGDVDNPDSWQQVEVQTIGRDTVAAETLFGVNKWGRTIDHPVRSLAAMGYYAMLRTGNYSGTFDDFERAYIEIVPAGDDVAFPTEQAPVPA